MVPMKLKQLRAKLKDDGFRLDKRVGFAEHWRCHVTRRLVIFKNGHKELGGMSLRDVYKQANWPFEEGKKNTLPSGAKVRSFADLNRLPIKVEKDDEPAPGNLMFSLDEQIEIVDLAEREGDLVAAEKYSLPVFRVKRWREELCGQPTKPNKSIVMSAQQPVSDLQPSKNWVTELVEQRRKDAKEAAIVAPLPETKSGWNSSKAREVAWLKRSTNKDLVIEVAELLLAGWSPRDVKAKTGVSTPTTYRIAQGDHRNLPPGMAQELAERWKGRDKKPFVRLTDKKTIAHLYDLIVHDQMTVQSAAKAVGVSEALAHRIIKGEHANVTPEQVAGFARRPRKHVKSPAPKGVGNIEVGDLKLQNQKLQKENVELREALKQALDLVLQIKKCA